MQTDAQVLDAPLDVLSAADLFMQDIDENGFMPGDDGYTAPVAETEEPEEVEEEETEDEESDEESEEEDEETSEEEEDKPKTEEEDPLFEVQIGDDVYEVNEEELKAGYLRNEAFVGRSTQLEKEYSSKVSALTEKEVQIEAEIEALIMLQSQDLSRFRNVNWTELKVVDPEKYRELRSDYHDAQEKVNIFQSRKQELNAQRAEAEKIKHNAYVREQQALATKLVPEFADPAFQTELIKFGKEIGYTEEELRGIADARHLMLLNQSRLYAQSQLKRKEALEKKVPKEVPKVAKPGAPQAANKPKVKAIQAAQARLKSNGDVRSAANLFAQLDIFN